MSNLNQSSEVRTDIRISDSSRSVLINETSEEQQDGLNLSEDNVAETRDSDLSSDSEEVILCLFYRMSKMAAAAYTPETSEMRILYDVIDLPPDFRLLQTLFFQLKPSHVVTCSTLSDKFLMKIHSLVSGDNAIVSPAADPPSFSDKVHFIPAKEFRYSSCKRSVLELRLPGEPENATEVERHHYISSLINVTAECGVCAAGGLLYYLQRSLSKHNLSNTLSPILHIHPLSMKDMVWIDGETLQALQVFSPVDHPSLYKWSLETSKEGLSVYSMLNRCYSNAGAKYMRVILSQPTRDLEVLKTRHEVISFCSSTANTQVVKSLKDSIVHVKSVMKMLTRMTNAQASVRLWKSFYNTVYNSVLVAEVCKAHSNEAGFFKQIADCLCEGLFIMSHCINRIMDFDTSLFHNRVVVKSGICDELDHLKAMQSKVQTVLGHLAEQELQQLPDHIDSCSMALVPEVGYLLKVNSWAEDLTEEQMRALPNLQYMFNTKSEIYYRSAFCIDLDNQLGDCSLKVIEMESKIVLKLVQYIQRNIAPLVKLTALIAELDCLLAFSQAAKDHNLVRPRLSANKQLMIRQGRHLLQEACVDMFVPNDTESLADRGCVHILSGPNASGKSVYLKQVALIVYLAHVGSFVPAEQATIGLVDQIHSRIQTAESVSTQLSGFMIDLSQMSLAVRSATANSLVIVDEFGKGTSEIDALGILAACLRHFITSPDGCPHLLVSTHFHSLPPLLPDSPLVKLQHLDHIVDKDELVYLYRLKDGAVQSSFALQTAQAYDLPKALVDTVLEILNKLKDGKAQTIQRKTTSSIEARRKSFLRKLSIANLDHSQLDGLKEELLSLQLQQ